VRSQYGFCCWKLLSRVALCRRLPRHAMVIAAVLLFVAGRHHRAGARTPRLIFGTKRRKMQALVVLLLCFLSALRFRLRPVAETVAALLPHSLECLKSRISHRSECRLTQL
jgi:hypothetical protein